MPSKPRPLPLQRDGDPLGRSGDLSWGPVVRLGREAAAAATAAHSLLPRTRHTDRRGSRSPADRGCPRSRAVLAAVRADGGGLDHTYTTGNNLTLASCDANLPNLVYNKIPFLSDGAHGIMWITSDRVWQRQLSVGASFCGLWSPWAVSDATQGQKDEGYPRRQELPRREEALAFHDD